MPDFNATLTDNNVTVSGLSYSQGTLTISDYSNYIASTESGHLLANFTDYKKIIVTDPDDTEYTFSSQTGGDELISAPSTYLSTPVAHTYSYTLDGIYKIKLIAVPTWSNSATYQQYDCVYYNSNLYKALQTSTGNNPETATTYWELVSDEDKEISSKYYVINGIAIIDDIKQYWANLLYEANLSINSMCDDSELCKNELMRKAIRIDNMIQILELNILNSAITDFEKAEDIIDRLDLLCDCVNV